LIKRGGHGAARCLTSLHDYGRIALLSRWPLVRVQPGAPFDSPAAAFGEPQARSWRATTDRENVLSERSESKGNPRFASWHAAWLREAPRLAPLVASGSESLGTEATKSRRRPAGRATPRRSELRCSCQNERREPDARLPALPVRHKCRSHFGVHRVETDPSDPRPSRSRWRHGVEATSEPGGWNGIAQHVRCRGAAWPLVVAEYSHGFDQRRANGRNQRPGHRDPHHDRNHRRHHSRIRRRDAEQHAR
jgi:hypothetical protein